ncbi:MAG: hypothetical protein K6F53_12150 [Lachnospiraceae bacterium]|nr:hypothetical protein [Lachnospiraceae bacterium]
MKKKAVIIDENTPLLILAGPMFLELFLNTMLNNVDTLMLSHYDEYAVGAVGNANTIMFMMNILFSVIATATSVVVAQYLGAKLYDRMNMIYTLAVTVNLVVGAVISAAFCAANPLIMNFLHVSPEMRPYSMIYIYIVGGGGLLPRSSMSCSRSFAATAIRRSACMSLLRSTSLTSEATIFSCTVL